MTAPLTLPAHEHAQTLKVIDRLEELADMDAANMAYQRSQIDRINHQISQLQGQRAILQDRIAKSEVDKDHARHAAEMLLAELEGEGDPRWRLSSPDAAKAEEHARAAIEKQDTQALKQALCLRDEGRTG